MNTKPISFKESKWGALTFLLFLIGALMSIIPEESLTVLIINFIVATFASLLNLVFWRLNRHDSKRYFSLASYIMLISMGFFASTPLLRELVGTIYLWFVIGLLLLIILPTHFLKERLLRFISNPHKGMFGKIFLILGIIIGYFGGFVWIISISAYDQVNNLGMLGSLAVFGIAALLLFLAPVMLNKTEKVKQVQKSVNS